MITAAKQYHIVAELMEQSEIGIEQLACDTGMERWVIEAIVHQRYTPSLVNIHMIL